MSLKLSQLFECRQVDILRDGMVQSLGMLNSPCCGVLAPVGDQKYLSELSRSPNVTAVITTKELADQVPAGLHLAVARLPVEEFFAAHIRLSASDFYWKNFDNQIDSSAIIHPAAVVADRNVRIGSGSRISAGCVIGERVVIGERSQIYPNCTIGADGYEVRLIDGVMQVIPHAGSVRIGNNVTIQSNSVVCRSLFGEPTEIGDGSSTDSLVHVAHNVKVGRRCRIAASAMLAGSCNLGDECWVGPSASISSGVQIGRRAKVTIGSVVTRNVEDGGHVTGNFAIEHPRYLAFLKSVR